MRSSIVHHCCCCNTIQCCCRCNCSLLQFLHGYIDQFFDAAVFLTKSSYKFATYDAWCNISLIYSQRLFPKVFLTKCWSRCNWFVGFKNIEQQAAECWRIWTGAKYCFWICVVRDGSLCRAAIVSSADGKWLLLLGTYLWSLLSSLGKVNMHVPGVGHGAGGISFSRAWRCMWHDDLFV
jgi:hypothetical protein